VTVGEGIMEPLSVAYMFKQLSLRDWVSFNELLGTPIRLGFTSAAQESPAWAALADALESIGQDFSAVLSEGSRIEFKEVGKTGSDTFAPLVDRMDRAIARICRGADLSTMSAGQGSGQGASLQGDEAELLEQDDAALIGESLQHVSRIVIRELFGEDPLAYVSIVVPQKKDVAQTRENVKTLVSMGGRVSTQWLHDELGIPQAAEDETTLTSAAASPLAALASPLALANAAEKGRAALFRAAALAELSAAQAETLRPLLDRLAEIEGIEDETAFDAALAKLQRDLPRLARGALADPAVARALEKILGASLASGAAEAAQKQRSSA
jgi:phage gp29-like protein